MTAVAVVLVTRNSERYLQQTLESIAAQTQQPDLRIAIDDNSTDASADMLKNTGFDVYRATSGRTDATTRIAHNFHQGVRLAQRQGAEIVVLGDHDDVWRKDRIAHQVGVLELKSTIAMVASDGFLIDEHGAAIPGTIRSTFPVPDEFPSWSRRQQASYGLRHSLATGGASALRPSELGDWRVPAGWLHDRWWSIKALRVGRLLIDSYPVIDYRVSTDQQVGLDTASQDRPSQWWASKVRNLPSSGRQARDLTGLLRG